jgi:Ca2+-transporting ATPase
VLPGRARIEVPGLRGDERLAARLEVGLLAARGVRAVSASIASGRVLVGFDPRAASARAVKVEIERLLERPPAAGVRADRAERRRWHALSLDAVLESLQSSREGLTAAEARRRLGVAGENRVVGVPVPSTLELLLAQIETRPVLLLVGAAGLSLALGQILEAGAMGLAIGANVAIGFFTEKRSNELIRSFHRPETPTAWVRREGEPQRVPAATLVPGDVILLRAGDAVPADGRVLEARELQADESSLTGESVPVEKQEGAVRERARLAERSSLVHRGTTIVAGAGEAVVVATGSSTEVGRLARLLEESEPPETPLERELDELSRRLELLGLAATGTIFLLGLARGRPLGRLVRSAIALGVAAIPEGLPATATTALALSMRRLRARGIVVRRLASAETLGSATVICCDKTGTLTKNEMRLARLWTPSDEARRWLLWIRALSNDVRFASSGALEGSPTERALVESAARDGIQVRALARARPKVASRPRRPGIARAVTVHRWESGELYALAKGSPDALVEILEDRSRAHEIEEWNSALASQGMRVLACGWRRLPEEWVERDLESGFRFAGIVALEDPLRPDAPELIARTRAAGLRCIVVTGDQLETARSVAVRCGLPVSEETVVEAPALERLGPAEIARLSVVARATPEDKLRVVRALQEQGEVVAMAGDGVNDAIALRAADVGIALTGRGPSLPVALSDVILATESMEGILAAIAEGRTLRDNIRRAAHYLLSTNASEIVLMLAGAALGLEDPLSPLQLLWINLVGDTAPAIALALEPGEADVLVRPPARRGGRLVSSSARTGLAIEALVLASGGFAAYGLSRLRGASPRRARSTAAAATMVGQLLHALRYRARRSAAPSRNLVLATGAGLLLEATALVLPPLARLSGTVVLGPVDAAIAASCALGPQALLALGRAFFERTKGQERRS